VALFFCYYLYKNLTLLVADLAWMHWDGFAAHIAFPEYLSIAFNAFFTSWHILLVLGFDRDLPDAISNLHPELYRVGPQNELFNAWVFGEWMLYALEHGLVAWLVPFAMVGDSEWTSRRFWVSSTCAFTNVVHICCLKLVMASENPLSQMTLLPTLGAWIMYVCYLWGLCYTPLGWNVQPTMRYIAEEIFTVGGAITTIMIAPPLALSLDFVVRTIRRYKYPSALQTLRAKLRDGRVSPQTATCYKSDP